MCGIISYFSNDRKYHKGVSSLIRNAMWIGSIRGDHSTGVIYESEGEPDFYKKAVAGWDFVQLDRVKGILGNLEATPYFIGHNRAATKGDVTSANAHPFEHDNIIGVHNGTLYNHHSLTTTNHVVDSDALYKAISVDGVGAVIPKVSGAFNLLWHDSSDNTIHILRNEDRPYTLAKLKGVDGLVGMSEELMLRWLVAKSGLEVEYIWNPKANREYVFDVEGDMTKPVRKVDHEAYVKPVYVQPTTHVYKGPANKVTNIKYPTMPDKPSKVVTPIEFLVDSVIVDTYLVQGNKVGTWYGETMEGDDVVIFLVPEGDLESGDWYEANATWEGGRWRADVGSIKLSPLYLSDDKGVANHCDCCYAELEEKDLVVTNNEVLCIACCQAYAIEAHEVDIQHRYKMH